MFSDDQSAHFKISFTDTPVFFAAVTEAARVECAVKSVGMPDCLKIEHIQRAIVDDDTGRWGLMYEIINLEDDRME